MIERLVLVVVLAVAAAVAFYLLRTVHMRRMQPAAVAAGVPTLLYFRSDTCAVCPTQGRYVSEVATDWDGRLRVQTVDAATEIELTSRFQVFTLPTTILLDRQGNVSAVNYGLTDSDKLARQLHSVAGTASRRAQSPAIPEGL